MPHPSMRLRQHGTERMLILRVALTLGLAVLLVIGAWSTSHGKTDAHSALCLAPGASADSTASASGHHGAGITVVDAVSSDGGLVVAAALCCFLLVLLLLRFGRASHLIVTSRALATSAPTRAGPRLHVPALTLTQLSLSRT